MSPPEILSLQLSRVHDTDVFEEVLDGINDEIEQVSADGAYDQNHGDDALIECNARVAIPPRKNAKIWQYGPCSAPPPENLRAIRKRGCKKWKKESHYHRHPLAETKMFRLKTISGGQVRSRNFENQAIELLLQGVKPDRAWVDA